MIAFKTDRERDEWNNHNLNPKVKAIVRYIDSLLSSEYDLSAIITSIYRTREEQQRAAIGIGEPTNRRSVHEFWRGVDVRVHDWPDSLADAVAAIVNGIFVYDDNRLEMKTAIVHGEGENRHLHLQVNSWRESWR